jgi:hypothetical protein
MHHVVAVDDKMGGLVDTLPTNHTEHAAAILRIFPYTWHGDLSDPFWSLMEVAGLAD